MAPQPKSVGHDSLAETWNVLGGSRLLGRSLSSPLVPHDLIYEGLPVRAVLHLVRSIRTLGRDPLLLDALGISRRTLGRWHTAPGNRRLSRAQGGRAWVLATTLVQASAVFGGQDNAEQWLRQPVASLSGRRPLELLTTPMGARLVTDHLVRLEYCVYT